MPSLGKGDLLTKERANIQLGLIGTGNIGRTHLTAFLALQEADLFDVEITGICDIDENSLESAAELFSVENVYTDYNELLAEDAIDMVYICTPTNRHSDMVKAAARAGKPLFCEKPLAHSAPQAGELLAVTNDAQVPAAVGLVLRYDQFLVYAKNLLETHDFGAPMMAHIRDDQRFPVDYIYYSKWRGDRSIAGGGTLIEHSIHDIDILRWFLGEVESLTATIGFYSGREVEDHASIIMKHVSGAVTTLDSIWHWVERPNERSIEFFFERGYIGIRLESAKRYLEYHLQGRGPVRLWPETANTALLDHLGFEENGLSPDASETLPSVGT
ncbi:Gfo/Idh/MocA family oxidoreductase, partial [Candidatus Thorarchaeota archaeon]